MLATKWSKSQPDEWEAHGGFDLDDDYDGTGLGDYDNEINPDSEGDE